MTDSKEDYDYLPLPLTWVFAVLSFLLLILCVCLELENKVLYRRLNEARAEIKEISKEVFVRNKIINKEFNK